MLLFVFLLLPPSVSSCMAKFEKELRYLDLYLGIRPDNDGELPIDDPIKFSEYITSSGDLHCTFDSECLWANLASDNVLDTSEFWYFHKRDDKIFPDQLQPGPKKVAHGAHFAVAGNTTAQRQSAVLLSAPVACQKGEGRLAFNYWLYNFAEIQVMVVKSAKRRGRLQIISKPEMDCHFYRPQDDVCQVTIPQTNEPFRLAIRAFNLRDTVVGSMVLLNNITYTATICDKSPVQWIFHSSPIYTDLSRPAPITALSDLNCMNPAKKCRWGNSGSAGNSSWRLGTSNERWNEIMQVSPRSARPNSSFVFQAVDGLARRPFTRFVSDLIPCTSKPTTLSFRYWTKTGTQVEVCSLDERDVPLSCAYLDEDNDEGAKPVEIVVDAYSKPMRFSFEMINFDASEGGVVVLTEMRLAGLLCSEKAPPVLTTVSPNEIAQRFSVAPRPPFGGDYPLELSCDWIRDPCYQWVDEEAKLLVGVAPYDSEEFPFPDRLVNGNVGLIYLHGIDTAVLHSREVPCAYNLVVTLTYWRSEHGFIRMCALDQCADGGKSEGKIALKLSSRKPFEISIEMRSRANSVVVIDSIFTEGDACPIKTIEQTLCDNIRCTFQDNYCGYDSRPVSTADVETALIPENGVTVTIDVGKNRAVLASSSFELIQPVLLIIHVTQHTFGSRLLLCPDAKSEPSSCNELLGPIVPAATRKKLTFPLEPSTRRFAIIFLHDKALQFGPARFDLHSIDVRTSDDYQLCF